MRRWQLCLSLSFLASAMTLPAAEAALSAGQEAGSIVAGVLVDAADGPVAGSIELFAWPTGRPVEVGQTVHLLRVGHDRSGKDGRFAIAEGLTPDLADLARLNGGYVNFVLQATAVGVIEETHFSRYVGETPFTAQEAGSVKRPVEWRASPDEAAEPVMMRLNRASQEETSPGRIYPMQGGCWGNKLVGTEIGYTVIGELRAPQDTLESRFVYGERADSEIGVAARGSQGPWGLAGSFHIANADDTEVKQWAKSGEHLLVTSRFMYDKYEYICAAGRRERVVPREWMGDIQSRPTLIRGCAGVPEGRMGDYGHDTEFKRDRERAVEWNGAVSVFGAELTARSGYSRWVRGHWKFGSGESHPLCGDDAPPKRARRIFAGTSA